MAKPPIMRTPDGKDFTVVFENLTKDMIARVADGAKQCLDIVALYATQKHMIMTRGLAEAATKPVHSSKLMWRTARLAGSLLDKYRFTSANLPTATGSLGTLAMVTKDIVGFAKTIPTTRFASGGKKEGYREVKYKKGQGYFCKIGTKVPYAAQHEFGIPPYPKRPFLVPGLDSAKGKFPGIMTKILGRTIEAHGF